MLTAAVRVYVGDVYGQAIGQLEQFLKTGDIAPGFAGAAMDRAPAADICCGLYGKRGCLWGEWIMASEKLYSQSAVLEGSVAGDLDFFFLRIKAGHALPRDQRVNEADGDADPAGFDAVDQRSNLARHIKSARYSSSSQHPMPLGATEGIGEVHVRINEAGNDKTVGRVNNEIG